MHQNHTATSEFRLLSRRTLIECPNPSPFLQIDVSPDSSLSDEEYLRVTVTGVLNPSGRDWVAMISPANSNVENCQLSGLLNAQTGDLSELPLLCHYPVKAQYVSNDPNYLSCKNKQCQMRLTWVSGNGAPQQVQYGNGMSQTSVVSTFTQADMCTNSALPSPAADFGWHDPGFIHSAVMKGLQPSSTSSTDMEVTSHDDFFCRFYSYILENAELAPIYSSLREYHSNQFSSSFLYLHKRLNKIKRPNMPGSISVINAVTDQVNSVNVDSIFHIGDISYATGFLVEWDFFLSLIKPVASKVSYMTAIGNHERDYAGSGSVYVTPDSGGECGVAYDTYFQMPTPAMDKPWYSIEQASVHFTVISTEHDWSVGSEQYNWMAADMGSVNRSKTPWLIFMGHRPMYTSSNPVTSVDPLFVVAVEPLLLQYKVDLALFGHVHNYERTCAVYQGQCLAVPTKDANGVDTYNNTNYSAPVQAIIGMAGFTLDNFTNTNSWSLVRISEFGYVRVNVTATELYWEFVDSITRNVEDSFRIIK
ncbi:putative inactive purple acid phosphatase 27 [Morella rubra]|uniref:Purple acid phosphatase n=1 Tax=Morella rubra TaxID=262757 RepID=A0A6A1WY15_9ROSI|nr:putative inactive purple acid phosphatase 27 [Morella rubra]